MLVSPLPSSEPIQCYRCLSIRRCSTKKHDATNFYAAPGRRTTVVSKRQRSPYSPLVHMVGPELPELGPVLRTPLRGFLFLQVSVGLRFGVFRTAPMTKLPVFFCLMCFFFFPLSPALS